MNDPLFFCFSISLRFDFHGPFSFHSTPLSLCFHGLLYLLTRCTTLESLRLIKPCILCGMPCIMFLSTCIIVSAILPSPESMPLPFVLFSSRATCLVSQICNRLNRRRPLTIKLPSPPFTPAFLRFTLGFVYTGILIFSHRSYSKSIGICLG